MIRDSVLFGYNRTVRQYDFQWPVSSGP